MRRLLATGLVALVALVGAGCGDDDDGGAAATTTSAAPKEQCSAIGVTADLSLQDLPPPVATTRTKIVRSAVACDYDALQSIAMDAPGFNYSFGGGRADKAAEYWRGREAEGEPVMRYVVQLLGLPHARTEGNFVWPSAHQDKPSEADWNALTRVYTAEQVAQFRAGGSYLGYRIGISPTGDWLYFVAGD